MSRTVGLLSVSAMLMGLFFVPLPDGSVVARAWFDWLHLPLFAIIYGLLYAVTPRIALPMTVVLSILPECLQPMVGRDFDGVDILRNLSGGALAWAATRCLSKFGGRALKLAVLGLAMLSVAYFTINPLVVTSAAADSAKRFPQIFGGSEREMLLWEFADGVRWRLGETEPLGAGDPSIAVEFEAVAGWPGVAVWVQDRNWNDYETLVLEACSHREAFLLGLRVDEVSGAAVKRHHFQLEIDGDWKEIQLDLNEIGARADIRRLVLFVEGGERRSLAIRGIELR